MSKVETTTKKFKEEGVRISGNGTEIHWESTGHLSVRLLDELGVVPLGAREVKVQIPKEGLVELVTDSDGKVFHPDVPFEEYELDLGGGVRVYAPAVANRSDVHDRHVPGVRLVYANLVLFDAAGEFMPDTEVTLEGPDGESFTASTDGAGTISDATPRPGGPYKLTCSAGTADTELAARPDGIGVVRLGKADA